MKQDKRLIDVVGGMALAQQEPDWSAVGEAHLVSLKRDTRRTFEDATVIAMKKTLIEMAEQSWLDLYGRGHNQLGFVESLNRFASLVRQDERISWPKRTWVGLTNEEIQEVAKQARSKDHAVTLTNKLLKEKNT